MRLAGTPRNSPGSLNVLDEATQQHTMSVLLRQQTTHTQGQHTKAGHYNVDCTILACALGWLYASAQVALARTVSPPQRHRKDSFIPSHIQQIGCHIVQMHGSGDVKIFPFYLPNPETGQYPEPRRIHSKSYLDVCRSSLDSECAVMTMRVSSNVRPKIRASAGA